jgi:hypothetical protein
MEPSREHYILACVYSNYVLYPPLTYSPVFLFIRNHAGTLSLRITCGCSGLLEPRLYAWA